MRKHGKWTALDLRAEDFNSHSPTMGRYARMLAEWNASKEQHNLTAADIARILGMNKWVWVPAVVRIARLDYRS